MADNTQTQTSTMSFGMKIWLTQSQLQTQKYSNLDYKVLYTFNNELPTKEMLICRGKSRPGKLPK